MNNPSDILSLFNIDKNKLKGDAVVIETDNLFEVYIILKDDDPRECPYCHSHNVYVHERIVTRQQFNMINGQSKQIVLIIQRYCYKCKNCNRKYRQKTELIEPYKSVLNPVRWTIFELTQTTLTFKEIAHKVKLSLSETILIFDQMVKYYRQPLPKAISIDEKEFKTNYGKYICVLSDAITGDIIDIFAGRKKAYINEYFDKISQKERQNVEFIASDMFNGFKTLANIYFPNAIHILDFFHIKQLFLKAVQVIRIQYMKQYDKKDFEYKVLKSSWAHFLRDKTKNDPKTLKKIEKQSKKYFYDKHKKRIYFYEAVEIILNDCRFLHEIADIYYDFNRYVEWGTEPAECENDFFFIINKCITSEDKSIRKLGYTLQKNIKELINSYSTINYLHVSNSKAEGNNNLLQKLISSSYGLRNFQRFRNRIIHIKRAKNQDDQ